MKSLRCISIAVLALATLIPARAEPPADPAGHWEGQITLPATPLAIRVDLERAGDAWSGPIDIPAQGLRGFKLQPMKVDGTAVSFTLPNIPGEPTFAGQWDKEAGSISGDFSQNGFKFPFKLEHRARPAGRPRPKGCPAKVSPAIGKGRSSRTRSSNCGLRWKSQGRPPAPTKGRSSASTRGAPACRFPR